MLNEFYRITADDRIRALTARHPIKPTSLRCGRRTLTPGDAPLIDAENMFEDNRDHLSRHHCHSMTGPVTAC